MKPEVRTTPAMAHDEMAGQWMKDKNFQAEYARQADVVRTKLEKVGIAEQDVDNAVAWARR